MTTSSNHNQTQKLWEIVQLDTDSDIGANRPTHKRIRVRIPKEYNDEPVISRLVSHYGVTVNITAAFLGANARDDGWFDLDLRGTNPQIQSALTYLNEMDLEMWNESNQETDGW